MKRLTAMLLALLLVLSLAGCGGKPAQDAEGPFVESLYPTQTKAPETPAPTAPLTDARGPYPAESYDALAALLRERRGTQNSSGGAWAEELVTNDAVEAPMTPETGAGGMGSAEPEYSGTNVQTQGIDEGDIVKTDGQYLYVLHERNELLIVSAAGADSAVLSRTKLSHYDSGDEKNEDWGESRYPMELMLSGHTLAVLSSYYSWHSYYGEEAYRYDSSERLEVVFYDVSDPAAPVKTATLGQDGGLLASRMQEGTLYLVSRWNTWTWNEDDPVTYIPRTYAENEGTLLPADSIFICPGGSGTNYLNVGAYDLNSGACLGVQSLLGSGERVYMSADRLYVAGSRYERVAGAVRTESVYTVTDYVNGSVTELHCFALGGGAPVLTASGSVPGYLDSQFSMDEYAGHLRLVTTVNSDRYTVYEDKEYGFTNYRWPEDSSRQSNALYILDAGLNVVGSVEELAEGEQVYSARFDGDIAYFCTFRQTDPLFAVDVSDPTNPVVRSALKISGFSEYLHSWSDGLLLGLGREADETTGWAQEMKLVMFDVSDKTDVTAAHTLRCDCSYSEALYDHKAVFLSPEKNLIGFLGEGDYYLYSYTPENGFALLAKLDFGSKGWDARGFYIGDTVYLIGSAAMLAVDMADWSVLTTVPLEA